MLKRFTNKIPWQIKLVILMLFMAIIPGLLISYGITGVIRDELKSNINGQLIFSSNSIAASIDSEIKKNIEFIEFTKNIIENPRLGAEEKIALMVSSVEKIDNLLLLNLSINENNRLVEVLNTNKDVVHTNSNNHISFPNNLKAKLISEIDFITIKEILVCRPFYSKELGTWVFAIVLHTNSPSLPNGYLTALFNLTEIASEIESNILSKIGSVFISDVSQLKFLSNKFLTDVPDIVLKDAVSLLNSNTGMTLVNNYYDNKTGGIVSCFSRTKNTNWIVISSIKEKAAYAVVNEAFMFFLIFIIISVLLSLITAYIFSNHISKPIIKMAEVSKEISVGNFDARGDYAANDSIGLLSDSLGQMGEQLKKNFSEIEKQKKELEDYSKNLETKVEQRTAELNESNRELKKAYHRVLELNEEKNEFLGIAAHDLKNPLTAISAFAEILKEDKELPEDQRDDFLDEIAKASSRMFSIVKNLLDVNAIEQGKLNTTMEEVSIKAINRELILQFKDAISKKEIKITENYSTDNYTVYADPNLTMQILQNILSNAIKFSPPNKNIYLLVRESADPDIVEICIKDEGPGFTDDDKKKLFQKFARLSARPTAGEHSTGLGLSIVKKLVEMMGGTIRLKSVPGEGAEFIISLPVFNK
jgi:signal transduction histidine kinase